ncbi:MAG: hypothetical protein E5299_01320 [Burkholderia gladioli]|nr:MAG: hypothetical protein E5299_01320 [Burkholderia gladioli]
MVGLTADHHAERDQCVKLVAFRELLQRQRDFQRTGHGNQQHVLGGDAKTFEFLDAGIGQAVADGLIEARLHDADAKA